MTIKGYSLQVVSCMMILCMLVTNTACSGVPTRTGMKILVLATTSIIGDVVNQVGGDFIDLSILMPVGTDPHDFQLKPQDMAMINEAKIIFSNGGGLEAFLGPILENTGASARRIEVSSGVTYRTLSEGGQSNIDPHTWMDPNNVIIWTQNIATALSDLDPAHSSNFQANAEIYIQSLRDLDSWIRSEVAQIPMQNRLLVADHAVFGYLAAQYGFTEGGSITSSFSSEAAPSARELAALEDKIWRQGVRAVFVSEAVNQAMADQIAADTGIKSVRIYHASLTAATGPVASYLEFMRYNVRTIVEALK
jgi:ABC-type Zn uptake system ZnuABC Zn-binding protein ZnuA